MSELKIPNKKPKYIDETVFLLKLGAFLHNLEVLSFRNIEEVSDLQKERKRIQISDETIKEFGEYWDLNKKYLNTFLMFNPKIDSRDLIKQGYKGIEIGKEIKRREIEEFKKLLDIQEQTNKYNL